MYKQIILKTDEKLRLEFLKGTAEWLGGERKAQPDLRSKQQRAPEISNTFRTSRISNRSQKVGGKTKEGRLRKF